MKINGVSDYQQMGDNFDIILNVDFGKAVAEYEELISPSVFVTYDKDGKFKHYDICDEGLPTDLELEEWELKQIHFYVEGNGLKEKLFLHTQTDVN